MRLKGKKINVLGDSITEGKNLDDDDARFTSLLAKSSGAIVRNYGVGGTRIAVQKKSVAEHPEWDADFLSRIDGMDDDADVVIVFGGVNDYSHGDAPLGNFSDRTGETFYGALHELYTRLTDKYPDARLVVATPLHRTNEIKENPVLKKGEGAERLETYVNVIKEVARYYALPVLDLYATSGIQPNVPSNGARYTADGLHPNKAGHRRLAQCFENFLKIL